MCGEPVVQVEQTVLAAAFLGVVGQNVDDGCLISCHAVKHVGLGQELVAPYVVVGTL